MGGFDLVGMTGVIAWGGFPAVCRWCWMELLLRFGSGGLPHGPAAHLYLILRTCRRRKGRADRPRRAGSAPVSLIWTCAGEAAAPALAMHLLDAASAIVPIRWDPGAEQIVLPD